VTRPRVAVISTGGTITSKPAADRGATPTLTAEEVVAALPQLESLADIECNTIRTIASKEMTLQDAREISDKIESLALAGCDGVVVLQGTDTLEEIAFAVDLLTDCSIPVVFTAAMRHPNMPSSDGPANLLSAVLVAIEPAARGLGVVVVLDDTVHAARYVRKAHTSSLSAFESSSLGALGWIHEAEVFIKLRPSGVEKVSLEKDTEWPKVALATAVLGDDLELLDYLEPLRYQGVIVEGLGGGHLTARAADRVGELAQRIPVVIASRTGAGQVLRRTYGTAGGDIDLATRGLLSAEHLDGPKARILLTIVLASFAPAEVAQAFSRMARSL
jgi:L-asparaginase